MGQDPQTDLAVLAVIIARPECGTEVALEHRVDGLRLPPLTIKDFREVRLHQLAVATPHDPWLAVGTGTTAVGGRNDTANVPAATEAVEAFRLVAGIPQQGPQGLVGQRVPDGRAGFRQIGLGAAVNAPAQDQMVGGIPDRRELGIAAFIVALMAFATFGVVGGNMPGLQAGRIDRGQRSPLSENLGLAAALQHALQEGFGFRFRQQAFARRPQGGEMWHLGEAQDVSQCGPLLQQDPDTAVIQAPEFLDHQTGEQLGLGELVRTLGMAIVGQTLLSGLYRLSGNCQS